MSVTELNEYQRLASRTANTDLSDEERINIAILGVNSEAGELAGHLKKWKGQGHSYSVDELINEAGDVLWYLAELTEMLGVSLSAVATRNIEKLKKRYPEGFDPDRSINRDSH